MLRQLTRSRFLISTILVLIVARGILLLFSPPGFFLDEAATGAHVVAMLAHGTNAHGEAWPLFSASLGGGYTTPVYLYPLTVWAAIFGASELSLRAFSQVVTIAAIAILACAMRLWLGNRAACIAAIVGLALPWGWLQGSLAWDPAMVPLFIAFGFLGFSVVLYSDSRKARLAGFFFLPLSLIALAYLYPPCRITAPLLFVGAYALLIARHRVSWRLIIPTCIGSAVVAVPLLTFILQPDALERSRELSVFHNANLLTGTWHLSVNVVLLVDPVFLFIFGDPNIRHATGPQGMLGIASLLPALALAFRAFCMRARVHLQTLIQRKKQLLVLVAAFGFVASILGSALTNEGQPHSLRATAGWLFAVILITVGWTVILASPRRWLARTAIALFVIGTTGYAVDLACFYPSRATGAFDASIREKIYQHNPPQGYPALSLQYYQTK